MTLKEIAEKIAELESRISALEGKSRVGTNSSFSLASAEKTLSPKEFLLQQRPAGAVHTTFLLGCYAEYHRQSTSFTISELEALFHEARVPVPANLNDSVNKNIAKGFLTEAKEKKNGKKAWVVTLTGEQIFKEQISS